MSQDEGAEQQVAGPHPAGPTPAPRARPLRPQLQSALQFSAVACWQAPWYDQRTWIALCLLQCVREQTVHSTHSQGSTVSTSKSTRAHKQGRQRTLEHTCAWCYLRRTCRRWRFDGSPAAVYVRSSQAEPSCTDCTSWMLRSGCFTERSRQQSEYRYKHRDSACTQASARHLGRRN